MAITLRDIAFPVKNAELCATIANPYWCDTYNGGEGKELAWCLDVLAECSDAHEIDAPHVSHDALHFDVQRWMEITGQIVSWDTPNDAVSGEPNGNFYVYGHESINSARLKIGGRRGSSFSIAWEGLCNVYWDETYGKDVPFSLQATAKFTGVVVHGRDSDTAESMRDRLALYLNPNDFEQHDFRISAHRYESGVGMTECRFTPKL